MVIKNIHQRLQPIFENDYEEFSKIMITNNAFIAGSLILQCILNEDWSSDKNTDIDIDIFNPVTSLHAQVFQDGETYTFTPLEDFLYKIGYDGSEDLQSYRFSRYGKHDVKTHPHIYRVRTYTKINKPKIQIISLSDYLNAYHFINEWTDFEFCKNLYIYDSKLIIKNINAIFNKTCPFNCNTLLNSKY